ncbi:MAG TPA: pitrilysin family protein [Polyangia bacterium]|jgi:zinc protease
MSMQSLVAIPGLVLLAVANPAAAQVRLPYTKYQLPNGLTVILHEDHALPIVAVNLLYRVGSKDEQPGRTGFAHLFEHLMFMGSKHVPGNAIDMIMEAAGGWNNASTGEDNTTYIDVGPQNLLETLLWIEADRLATLDAVTTLKQLDLQRDVVRNERRQSYENRPYGRAALLIPRLMFPKGHPYHWPVIGSHEDLEAATVGDVQGFFRRFYVPGNAQLVVAGDIKPAQVKQWVERYFGWLPRAEEPAHAQPQPVALAKPVTRAIKDRVQLPRLYYVYHSPAAYQPGDAEMDLVARVLAAGKNSRLYKTLVYDQQIAQDVSAFQESHRLGSLFYIVVTAKPKKSLAEIAKVVDAEIARVRQAPPTARELERARNGIEMSFFQSLEKLDRRADTLNGYEYFYGDPGAMTRDLGRYRAATPQALHRLATETLRPEARLVLKVEPGKLPDKEAPAPSTQPKQRPLTPRDLAAPAYMAKQPRATRTGDFTPPRATTLKLRNGIPVIVLQRRGLPLVSVNLAVRAGAELDPAEQPGLASLTASMLDEGAGARSALEIADEIDHLGAELSSGADRDASYVSLSVLTQHLPAALDIFADVALRPRFDEREWKRVKNDRLALLLERRDDPAYVARVVYDRVLYGDGHAYGRRVLGTEAAVRDLKAADLRRFHAANYSPRSAAFVVVGDVRPKEIRDQLDRLFGGWTAAAAPASPRPELTAPQGGWPRVCVVDRPGAEQSEIVVGRPGAARSAKEYAALLVMNTILGGSFTSRLNLNLREKHGYTYGAHSRFEFRRGPGPFWAGAAVKTDRTGDSVRQFLLELGRLAQENVPADELKKAKSVVERGLPELFQRNSSIAQLLTDLWVHDLPLGDYREFAKRVRAVTGAAVRAAARRYASPDGAAIVIVGDRKVVVPELKSIGITAPEVRDTEGVVQK